MDILIYEMIFESHNDVSISFYSKQGCCMQLWKRHCLSSNGYNNSVSLIEQTHFLKAAMFISHLLKYPKQNRTLDGTFPRLIMSCKYYQVLRRSSTDSDLACFRCTARTTKTFPIKKTPTNKAHRDNETGWSKKILFQNREHAKIET